MTPGVLLARAEHRLDELRAMDDGLPPSPKFQALLDEAEAAVAKAKIACDNWTTPERKEKKYSYDYFAPVAVEGDYVDPNENDLDLNSELDDVIRHERRSRFFPKK